MDCKVSNRKINRYTAQATH